MNYDYCRQGNDPIELVEQDIPEISMYLPLIILRSLDERQHLKGCGPVVRALDSTPMCSGGVESQVLRQSQNEIW